jgi:NAD(P)-dependent dehydrogenase (short-subunit alcohol dehydrogenase family)/SAM-dependent methyltransferase/acyl carrier protein
VIQTLGTGEYWVENLTSPVLFSQALTAATSTTKTSVIVEIGPHPALKGPALQTIASMDSAQVPYTGVSARGVGALEAMAGAIGTFWACLGPASINSRQYMTLFDPEVSPVVVTGLPLYPFDHRMEYGYETRKANGWMHKRNTPHPLLGSLSEDLGEGEFRWAQHLSPSRVPWLDGHRVQGQIVVPATAYIAMALEAARIIAAEKGRPLQLVQIEQLVIGQALTFQDERDELETLFLVPQMGDIDERMSTGSFRCQIAIPKGGVKTCAEGTLRVIWGEPQEDILPPYASPPPAALTGVEDLEGYYTSLREIGYQYTGVFRGIHSLSRKMGIASGQLHNPLLSGLLVHPAVLDTGLQGLLAAMGEGYLTALHVPTRIETVTINTAAFTGASLDFEAAVTRTGADGLVGDVELYTAANGPGAVFFEGVHVSPLSPPSAADDPPVFWVQRWYPLELDVTRSKSQLTQEWRAKLEVYEHRAFLVLQDLLGQITPELRAGFDWHRERAVAWIEHLIEEARAGRHAVCKPEWLGQRLADLEPTWTQAGVPIEDQIMHRVHQNLMPFLRGEAQMIDALREDELLTRFYRDELELQDVNRRVGELVGDLAVRYPRMKLLEVGAGTASATREVLRHVGRAYHSYTFTDISAGFFEDTLDSLPEHADRLIFQKLDVGQDPVKQGFQEHAYDVIIAANVLHATPSLETTLQNVRRLLKPGGYLVALEITNLHTIRIGLLMCAFDGWWLGHEDGRPWGPMVSASQWNDVLQETGFGGIDTISVRPPGDLTMYSVFAAQAVDHQISNLRKPLAPVQTPPPFERGVIVGGSPDLVADITALIKPFFETIELYSDIDSLVSGQGAVFLVLADLGEVPCFQDMTESRLAGLQTLVRTADKTLWVTGGSEADRPHLGLSKGFLTCMNYEHAPAMFQYLNVIDLAKAQPGILAEQLLRLAFTTQENDFALTNCLLSTELEMRVDREGNFLFPRINASNDLNTRYAAVRRPVIQSIENLQKEVVAVDQAPDGQLRLCLVGGVKSNAGEIIIDVRYSTSRAIRIDRGGHLTLVLGRDRVTKTRVVALTDRLASIISSSCFWEVPIHVSTEQEPVYLHAIACSLLAATIFKPSDTIVLVHGADDDTLHRAIAIQAAAQTIQPVFTTNDISSQGFGRSIRVHENDSLRRLARQIPRGTKCAVNLDPSNDRFFDRMVSAVASSGIPKEHLLNNLTRSLAQQVASLSAIQVQGLAEALRTAAVTAEQLIVQPTSSLPVVVPLNDLPSSAKGLEILDWATSTSDLVHAHVISESSLIRLSPKKTYLMIGMTSALGQSIAHWLVSRGARNVILTSRNPQIDPAWISELYHTTGARVEVLSMDVTKRESILSLARRLKEDWPPLGGVVNGAMVLWDRLFVEADLPLLAGQLAPKVEGSLLLDKIFGEEPTLDFFILFGSAVATIGNMGQSAYTAASNFLLGLAARRRARGLVASVIQPAQVTGDIGYLSGKGDAFWDRMFGMLGDHPVSEQDLHELFAHAILTGRGSETYPAGLGSANADDDVVLGGIRIQDPAKHPDILWFRTPKVWPFIRYHHQGDGPSTSSATAVPLAEQLKSATKMAQVAEVVEAVVTAKLHHRLHLPAEVSVTAETRLTELGVDSLIAVDLRRWFAQEFEVDIPVLQLLGGCSVRELSDMTSGLLDPKFYPGVVTESEVGDKRDKSDDNQRAESVSSSSYQVVTPTTGSSD